MDCDAGCEECEGEPETRSVDDCVGGHMVECESGEGGLILRVRDCGDDETYTKFHCEEGNDYVQLTKCKGDCNTDCVVEEQRVECTPDDRRFMCVGDHIIVEENADKCTARLESPICTEDPRGGDAIFTCRSDDY
eukprot:UN34922